MRDGEGVMSEELMGQLKRLEATYMSKIQDLKDQLEDAEARGEQRVLNEYAKELRATGRCPFCGAQE
jgi:hypothetical protein